MSRRVYVAADWSQLESWLTGFFAQDTVMMDELKAQLTGGNKIHANNAALIYGIKPEDAKTHKVSLQGRMQPAYNGGKRGAHAFNYGMEANHFAKTFWTTVEFAQSVIMKLKRKYHRTVAFREQLADQVFGVYTYECGRCQLQATVQKACPNCSTRKFPVLLRYKEVKSEPTRALYTAFGRRRLYLGRRRDGANAVASQLPQSSGASMWNRTYLRLQGYDVYSPDTSWPVPDGGLVWSPRLHTYGQLYAPFETFVATGTYDSFLVETTEDKADSVLDWLLWTMEQPWPELDGLRIPAEGSIGLNWRKFDDSCKGCGEDLVDGKPNCKPDCTGYQPANPGGLVEVKRQAFTYTGSYDRGDPGPPAASRSALAV